MRDFCSGAYTGKRLIEIVSLATGVLYLAGLAWGMWLQAQESVLRFTPGWSPELTPGPPHLPLPSLLKATLLLGTLLFLGVVVAHLLRQLASRSDVTAITP